ncbi:Integral membrane protein [Candidatus Burkholderia humilis]|nr:Integral membrane protein [Candidatus Burkholderia humilis]
MKTADPWLRWHLLTMNRRLTARVDEPMRALDTGIFSVTIVDTITDAVGRDQFEVAIKSLGRESLDRVVDLIYASQFKSEAQMFHTGVLNATQNDADFSAETLSVLVQNHAFDSADARVASDKSEVKGLFNGILTAAAGTLVTADYSLIMTYPVTSTICSLSVAARVTVYTEVTVNGTTIFSPTTAFDSQTAATECSSKGAMASIGMWTTRS